MQSILDILKKKTEGKKVAILGFGKEGKSTFKLIRNLIPDQKIIIADKNPESFKDFITEKNLIFSSGENYLNELYHADLVFKSPGISFKELNAFPENLEFTSQTDLFLEAFSGQIVGITGTKGKSTTSSLLYQLVKSWNSNTIFVGNIGVPPFDLVEKIDPETTIICEFSSHQLELIHKSPHIAVLLNIYQEHLDHYTDFAGYQKAKFNIAAFQNNTDKFIYCVDNENIKDYLINTNFNSLKIPYSMRKLESSGVFPDNNWIVYKTTTSEELMMTIDQPRKLIGRHNLYNIMAAIAVGRLLNISAGHIRAEIQKFQPLEHRMEYVGRFAEIDFFNDSISTIPESTIEAINAIDDVDTVILGGYDRGIDYQILADYLTNSAINTILLLGNAGRRIKLLLDQKQNNHQNIIHLNSFHDLKENIQRFTKPGKVCLLSPAASSYDMFVNFEERGRAFKKMAREFSE